MQREDLEEMEHLTVGLEDETTDDKVYPGDPNVDPPRVSFGPTSTLEPPIETVAPRTPMIDRLRDKLMGST